MFKYGQEVTASGFNYIFGCVNPSNDKFCILFDDDAKYCHAPIAEVKAKPKTKKVFIVYDKNGLFINQFQEVKPYYPTKVGNQIFELEVNV